MQGYSQGPATNQTDWLTDWHRGFGSHTVTLAQEITGDHRHQPFHLEPWRWSAVLLIVFPVQIMSDKTNLTGWYRVSIVIQSHQCWRLRSLFPRDLNASCWCNMLWDHLLSSPARQHTVLPPPSLPPTDNYYNWLHTACIPGKVKCKYFIQSMDSFQKKTLCAENMAWQYYYCMLIIGLYSQYSLLLTLICFLPALSFLQFDCICREKNLNLPAMTCLQLQYRYLHLLRSVYNIPCI